MDEKKERKNFGAVIKNNMQKAIIVIIAIFYITQGLFIISSKDTSILDILGNISLSLVVGLSISNNFNIMGLQDGRKSDTFQSSVKTYGLTKEQATPYFDKLASWCDYKNAQKLEYEKKNIIISAGLSWKAFKIGYYDEHNEKLNKRQLNALLKAKNCQVDKICSEELLSDLPYKASKFHKFFGVFGASERDYKTRDMLSDAFSKLFLSIVMGLYSLQPLFTEENKFEMIAGVLWNTMQIIIWVTFGIVKYNNARSFMEDEYRQTHIIQKTELLNEFIVTMKNNPNVIAEYDEENEIDAYIEEFLNKKRKLNNEENEQKNILD